MVGECWSEIDFTFLNIDILIFMSIIKVEGPLLILVGGPR